MRGSHARSVMVDSSLIVFVLRNSSSVSTVSSATFSGGKMETSEIRAFSRQLEILLKKLEKTSHKGRQAQLLDRICEVLFDAHAHLRHLPSAEPAANSLTNRPT